MQKEITQLIRKHHSFAITSHARPDGDSIGSELGLALALRGLGKKADVFNADPHPHAYSSLPGVETIRIVSQLSGSYDALFVLECNDLKRPGIEKLDEYRVVNIDHHPDTEPFGDLNWIDVSASAVGEMVFRLIRDLEVEITPGIATALYVAILTDTGSFQFSNTSSETFLVAAELVRAGASPSEIAQAVYMSYPHSKLRMLAETLDTLEVHPSGKIAWILLTDEMLRQTGASLKETEGIVNYPLSLDGIVLAAFFRQEGENRFRVSLRSKDHYDVGRLAVRYGGGGHRNAAGLSLQGSFSEVRQKLILSLERLLDEPEYVL